MTCPGTQCELNSELVAWTESVKSAMSISITLLADTIDGRILDVLQDRIHCLKKR